jgi:hypothetical protein
MWVLGQTSDLGVIDSMMHKAFVGAKKHPILG